MLKRNVFHTSLPYLSEILIIGSYMLKRNVFHTSLPYLSEILVFLNAFIDSDEPFF